MRYQKPLSTMSFSTAPPKYRQGLGQGKVGDYLKGLMVRTHPVRLREGRHEPTASGEGGVGGVNAERNL